MYVVYHYNVRTLLVFDTYTVFFSCKYHQYIHLHDCSDHIVQTNALLSYLHFFNNSDRNLHQR